MIVDSLTHIVQYNVGQNIIEISVLYNNNLRHYWCNKLIYTPNKLIFYTAHHHDTDGTYGIYDPRHSTSGKTTD